MSDNIRRWPKLKKAGVHELLYRAADVYKTRPLNKGSIRHRKTGAVDATGALAMASGTRFDTLTDNFCGLEIPHNRVAAFYAAIELVEAAVDRDISAWNDDNKTTKATVAKKFIDLATMLETVI